MYMLTRSPESCFIPLKAAAKRSRKLRKTQCRGGQSPDRDINCLLLGHQSDGSAVGWELCVFVVTPTSGLGLKKV